MYTCRIVNVLLLAEAPGLARPVHFSQASRVLPSALALPHGTATLNCASIHAEISMPGGAAASIQHLLLGVCRGGCESPGILMINVWLHIYLFVYSSAKLCTSPTGDGISWGLVRSTVASAALASLSVLHILCCYHQLCTKGLQPVHRYQARRRYWQCAG